MSFPLNLRLEAAQFPVGDVVEYLESRPDVLAHPGGLPEYLISGQPSAHGLLFEAWVTGASSVAWNAFVDVDAMAIVVRQEFADLGARHACYEFVAWLAARMEFTAREDGFADCTERLRTFGVQGIFPPEVVAHEPRWRCALIEVGFFAEHADRRGGVRGYRLSDVVSDTPQAMEQQLVQYLQGGTVLREFSPAAWEAPGEPMVDLVDPGKEVDAPRLLYTDGVYVWPSDLAYYVERYHARLPKAFWHHARNNGWRVPPVADVSALKMIDEGEPIPE